MSTPSIKKPLETSGSAMDRLLSVMKRLRDPQTGCPWDVEQTFQSIVPHTIEEAYEVADAIERNDMDDLKDELGDLLMQVVFHARIAEESGLFNFDDVAVNLVEKLVFRHPHVFGDQKARNSAEVMDIWEVQKAKKRGNTGEMASVTKGLPSLLRAHKLQNKAAKQGFTWKTSEDAWKKVEEEYAEVRTEIAAKSGKDRLAEELGDLMFCLVNYARLEGLEMEDVMRQANNKFISNYNKMDEFIQSGNKEMKDCTLDELLVAWKAARAQAGTTG